MNIYSYAHFVCFAFTKVYEFEHNINLAEQTELIISGKKYTSINKEKLRQCVNLELLLITNTSINEIPEGIEELKALSSFEFAHNEYNYKTIDLRRLADLPNLECLNLSGNNIRYLNTSISLLKNLKKLDISKNNLHALSFEIIKLSKLTYLDISYNKLKMLPQDLGKLVNLKVLYAESNFLTKLCKTFVNLKKLKSLNLNKNLFENIPLQLFMITNLRKVSLAKNRIQKIDFPCLSEIERICYNPNVYREIIRQIESSRQNYVSRKVKGPTLAVKAGYLLSSVTDLDLSCNNISYVSYFISMFKEVVYLRLSNNYIEEIPSTISSLKSIILLDLTNNNINYMPQEIVNITTLFCLKLQGNPVAKNDKGNKIGANSLLSSNINHIYMDYTNLSPESNILLTNRGITLPYNVSNSAQNTLKPPVTVMKKVLSRIGVNVNKGPVEQDATKCRY